MLRPFVNYLSKKHPIPNSLHKIHKNCFVRIKKKGESKISSKSMLGQAVVDDKFIKLNVKDDSTSKLKQLAKLREENIKIISSQVPRLESKIDDLTKLEFKKIKLNTKIDMYEEPLMLYSLVKEAQLKTSETRVDKSIDKRFDQDILRFHKMPKQMRKEELKPFNIERQINEQYNIQVIYDIFKIYKYIIIERKLNHHIIVYEQEQLE